MNKILKEDFVGVDEDPAFTAEYGLTVDEWRIMSAAGRNLAATWNKDECLRTFGNQIVDQCGRVGSDPRPVSRAILRDIQGRLHGPETPEEFYALYGMSDD